MKCWIATLNTKGGKILLFLNGLDEQQARSGAWRFLKFMQWKGYVSRIDEV